MPSAQPDKITIGCQCGGKFRVPAAAVGKKVKCPKCGTVLAISAPRPKVAPAPFSALLVRTQPTAMRRVAVL